MFELNGLVAVDFEIGRLLFDECLSLRTHILVLFDDLVVEDKVDCHAADRFHLLDGALIDGVLRDFVH